MSTATAVAHPNIALVKYWGKRDLALNLPATSSLSLTLGGYHTRTTVQWGAASDEVVLNGQIAPPGPARRVLAFLDLVQADRPPCAVHTHNDFPSAAGLASSASGFAALSLAATAAAGKDLDSSALSALARRGSGSACRSIWGGFVRWDRGSATDGSDSHGTPVAPASHWDVAMVVAIASEEAKPVGSTEGMRRTRDTSPLYEQWVATSEADVREAQRAVLARDIQRLGRVMESSTFKMHATMHTAAPPLVYWKPATVAAMHAVFDLRAGGTGAWLTMDAGPQVKVLCASSDVPAVRDALEPHVLRVDALWPGGDARLEPR